MTIMCHLSANISKQLFVLQPCSATFWSGCQTCDGVLVVEDDHNNNEAYIRVTISLEHFLVGLEPIVAQNGQFGEHHHDQDR